MAKMTKERPHTWAKVTRRTLRIVLGFVVVLVWSFTDLQHCRTHFSQRTPLSDTVQVLTHPTVRVVYLCGYKFAKFCHAVFPEYSCSGDAVQLGREDDILLVGMHARCESTETFKGKVVYINGEPDRAVQARNSFYLGPLQSEAKDATMSKQFFFVQIAALGAPQAVPSFIQRPRNSRKEFLLYISRRCLAHRENAFNIFSRMAPVTAGGKCRGATIKNAMQGDITTIQAHGSWNEAYKFYQHFKFGLVMENTKTEGYVSEKILNAFMGGTVPIYYGTEDVFKIFNRKAFVFYDEDDPKATVKEVERLLRDEVAYEEIMSQPILASGAFDNFFAFYPQGRTVAEIRKFLGLADVLAGDD